jgi:hypothetical protein
MPATASPKILRVVDTRTYEEVNDRWVPIPGSGNARECDRCGRLHEVHAEVQYPDGRIAVVGTGCMGLGSAVARRSASRAARIARLHAELRKLEAERDRTCAAWEHAVQLPVPAIVDQVHRTMPGIACGDVWVSTRFATTAQDLADRKALAVEHWHQKRAAEHLGVLSIRPLWSYESRIRDVLDQLRKISSALNE